MYRLLRHYRLSVHNLPLTTVQVNLQQGNQICSFCKFYHLKRVRPCNNSHAIHVRNQTTHSETLAVESPKLKKPRKNRKYAELLEVSNDTMINTKAMIKKLNAKNISQLANRPEISLDQVHKVKSKNHSVSGSPTAVRSQHGKVEHLSMEELDCSTLGPEINGIYHEREMLVEEDHVIPGSSHPLAVTKNAFFFNTRPECKEEEGNLDPEVAQRDREFRKALTNSKSLARSEAGKRAALVHEQELKRLGKQDSLRSNLQSYLEVCVNCGMNARALSTLNYYRHRGKRYEEQPKIVDVSLYNTLMHGFASTAHLSRIKDILAILKEDGIQANAQTYAAVFECMGRSKSDYDHTEFLQSILSDMRDLSISLNDVMEKSVFIRDQREMTNRGILSVEPDFIPVYTPPDISYANHLLEKLSQTPRATVKPADGLFTEEELLRRADRQIELEERGLDTVESVAVAEEPTPAVLQWRHKIVQYEETWRNVITEALKRDLTTLRLQNNTTRSANNINLYPYLTVLASHHYVDIILREIRRLATGSDAFSPSLNSMSRKLGYSVFHRYQAEMKKRHGIHDKVLKIYKQYCKLYLTGETGLNNRAVWQKLVHDSIHEGPTTDMKIAQWPTPLATNIGNFLYNIIMRDIRIDVNRGKQPVASEVSLPAFYTVFRTHRHMIMQEVKPHPFVTRMYKDAQLTTIDFETFLLPSITPPVPWYSVNNGGYLVSHPNIIRLSFQAAQQKNRLECVQKQQLYPVFDSLNQLGSIPWKINKSLLEIALTVFRNGGSKKLDIPEPPSSNTPAAPLMDMTVSKEERNLLAKQRIKERKAKADMYSLWCDVLYRLSLANHYRDDVFWLPHSMDFRGRVYPIPPHVNHLGSDLARSLMVFAFGKPLGPKGLDWLKIHIVNLTGIKKRESNDERLRYANEILPKILDSAEKPLTGELWWQKSEEPWQTLAAAIEISEALRLPNPADYVSRFPVHQDGSCNGLQHYAALGRDRAGAESVNLVPSSKPQDVYSQIAALVEKERTRDANDGVSIAIHLDGLISRKVIKQTVMTTVYGVTRFGARLQIARQLKDIGFPDELLWQASSYLACKTFNSLREMFTSAKLIQDWLTDCARLISFVCGEHVEWITPLGLPVVQPYNKRLQYVHGKNPIMPLYMDTHQRPNVMKQRNAFPPNFIHSLDSCHMMLTSLHCEHAGLTFVSVHDCFWTHASTIPTMNKICREQFVALHSEPILENLSKFLTERFSYDYSEMLTEGSVTEVSKLKVNNTMLRVPERGDFDLKSVLDSVYFFS